MTVVAVASAKGRGVSTAAELLVLLRGTGRRCLLVDADPAGGDWLLRPGIAPEPGLVSLAMAGRRRFEPAEASRHVQVAGMVEVVVGPAAGHQAARAVAMMGDRLVTHLRTLTDEREGVASPAVDAVLDCGRLAPGSPSLALAAQADLVVLVSPATPGAVVHLAPLVELVRDAGGSPAVLLTAADGRGARYEAGEIAAELRAEVLGTMADDPGAVARLGEAPGVLDGLGGSRLAKSMIPVADRVWAVAAMAEPAPPASSPAGTEETCAPIGWGQLSG